MKYLNLFILSLLFSVVAYGQAPGPITGPANICAMVTTTYTDATSGGSWSSSNPTIATTDFGGHVTGVAAGTTTLTYTTTGGVATMTITVNMAPPITGDLSLCAGASGMLSDATTGGTWSTSNSSVASIDVTSGMITGGLVTTTGFAWITYTLPGSCSNVAYVTVNPQPAAITGVLHLCPATSSLLSDAITGGSWSSSNTIIASVGTRSIGVVIAGMVTSTSTATITYAFGNCAVSTTVTVNAGPSLDSVTGGGSYCAGGAGLHIGLNHSNTGVNYQLYNGTTAVGSPIAGTGGALDFGLQTSAGTYTVRGSDAITGCYFYMIGTKTISIDPLPSPFLLTGTSGCSGSGSVSLAGSQTGIGYYLLYYGTTFVGPVVTGTGGPLTLPPITASGTYQVVGINMSTGCAGPMSDSVVITIGTPPTVHNLTGGGYICAGSNAPLSLDGSDAGISYQVYFSDPPSSTTAPVGSPVIGTGAALPLGLYHDAGVYSVVATGTGGCSAAMANTDTINIYPTPTAYAMTGGGSYCAGDTGVHIGLAGSTVGTMYQLYIGTTPAGTAVAGTGSAIDFGLFTSAGIYTVNATNALTGCGPTTLPGSVTLSIAPLPNVFTVIGTGFYCPGSTGVPVGLVGSESGVSYQLYNGGASVGSPMIGTGAGISFGPQTTPGVYTVAATRTATGCTANMASSATITTDISPSAYNVTGTGSYCSGGTGVHVGLAGSSTGISYTLYNGTVAMGAAMAGTGGALDFGTETTGTYKVVATNTGTGCTATMADSAVVIALPPVVPSVTITATPGDTVCTGTMVTYSATVVNGGIAPNYQWYEDGMLVSVDTAYTYAPANGNVIYAVITSAATCATPATATSNYITMSVHPLSAIMGGASVCAGANITLTDTSAGGVWTSSNPAVATIATIGAATGVVTGVGAGTAMLTYSVGACSVSSSMVVHPLPTITATAVASSCGSDYTLSAGGGISYSWAPTTGLACAACAVTDVVPAATTTYSVIGTDANGCTNIANVNIDGNRISGYISGGTSGMSVWLIQFDPTDSSLVAIDSTTACLAGGAPYYHFDDKAPGSYMVKAYQPGGTPGTSGYVPTYGFSSPYWNTANTIVHTSAADTMHINMIYGTVPSGPGFIGGLISSGAGRNTDAAAAGVLVYLLDDVSGRVLTYTYTDADGNYSFSGLGNYSYTIYPEQFGYSTTPALSITLSPEMESVQQLNFKRHTTARTITPATGITGVSPLASTSAGIFVYPNPASGNLNIRWNGMQGSDATVTITDMLGRQVYQTMLNIRSIDGKTQMDISSLKTGAYMISIQAGSVHYTGKLMIE